jgi:dTDP-4-dehydrorhamnose reductase
MKRALITGANGTIGSELTAHLKEQNYSCYATTRTGTNGTLALDLSKDPANWPELPEVEVAVLCAAASKLDFCEDQPEASARINVTAMQALAEKLQAQGTFLIFLSTNQVFDGEKPMRRADEPTCPLNEYGRQKAAFESWLLARPQPASVLRLTKVVSGELPIFAKWREQLTKGERIEAFEDLRFAPLPMASVLKGITWLASKKQPGTHQLSGLADISYFEMAQKLAHGMNMDASMVVPASALSAGIRPQFLPKFGTLDRSTMAHIPVVEYSF